MDLYESQKTYCRLPPEIVNKAIKFMDQYKLFVDWSVKHAKFNESPPKIYWARPDLWESGHWKWFTEKYL